MKRYPSRIYHKILMSGQGFTLLEVLVAILITSVFVMVAMQGLVLNAYLRVQSERQAQAIFWIQKDLEEVRSRASTLKLPENSNSATISTTCTSKTNGYGQYLASDLSTTSPIIRKTDTKDIVGANFTLNRAQTAYYNILKLDYEVKVTGSTDDKDKIATFYAEVIPNEAFNCD